MRLRTVPSRQLLWWAVGLGAASLVVIAFPTLKLVLFAADLALIAIAGLDWLLTPGPQFLRERAARSEPLY